MQEHAFGWFLWNSGSECHMGKTCILSLVTGFSFEAVNYFCSSNFTIELALFLPCLSPSGLWLWNLAWIQEPSLTKLIATSCQHWQIWERQALSYLCHFFFFFLQCTVEERGKPDEKLHFKNGVCGVPLRYTFGEQEIILRKNPLLA